jgi:protein KRI1
LLTPLTLPHLPLLICSPLLPLTATATSLPSLLLQHNKQREELQRLIQKYPEKTAQLEAKYTRQHNKAQANDDYDSSSSSSSDDDDDDNPRIPAKVDAKIFETLMKIRNKDESIYNKEAKFFSSDDEDEDDDNEDGAPNKAATAAKKDKPMYLKDIIYQQALADQEQGVSSDSEVKDHNNDKGPSTYTEEQKHIKDELLKAFHQAAEDVDGEDTLGGVLKRRGSNKKCDDDDNDNDGTNTDVNGGDMSDDKIQPLLNKYFGDKDDQLDAGDRFLKRYMLNRGWVDKDGDSSDDGGGGGGDGYDRGDRGGMYKQQPDVEEDEAYLEAAEQFEHTYNFRFEEPGGNTLSTHPRQIEGTVRKEDDRRKQKRKEKKERLQAEEEKRRAELRRLKNLKKAEIGGKLKEIQKVAGKAAPQEEALDAIMAGEFDPEAYDKAMAAAFGDDYYGAADEEFGSGGEDDEGEGEEGDEEEMVDKEFEKYLRQMASYGTDDEDEDADQNQDQPASTAEAVAGGGNTFAALQKKLHHTGDGTVIEGSKQGGKVRSRDDVLKLLEEYYKLDYEDVVAGIPTRFRYRSVPKQDFGLGVEDILALDDKELNQVVGLKKLAPYRDDWKKQRANYGALNAIRRDKQQQQRYGGGGGKRNVNDYPGDDDGDDKKKKEGPFMSKEEQRLASYAKPSLKRSGGGGGGDDESYHRHDNKKKARTNNNNNNNNNNDKGAAGGNNNNNIMDMSGSGGQQLTKAQKKNLKRSMKRASKKE